jgi:hypothetical protein
MYAKFRSYSVQCSVKLHYIYSSWIHVVTYPRVNGHNTQEYNV